MTNVLAGLSAILFILLGGLGYMYKSLEKDYIQSQTEVEVKDKSIKDLEGNITAQNDAINRIQVDVNRTQTIYKDRIKVITKTIEVQKESVKDLNGTVDCNKAKEIANDFFK
jgi:hypothetical protein